MLTAHDSLRDRKLSNARVSLQVTSPQFLKLHFYSQWSRLLRSNVIFIFFYQEQLYWELRTKNYTS